MVRKMRLNKLVQGHTAVKKQSWDLNPGVSISKGHISLRRLIRSSKILYFSRYCGKLLDSSELPKENMCIYVWENQRSCFDSGTCSKVSFVEAP